MDPTTRAAANVPLALQYARTHPRPGLDHDDAVSACFEGLVEAALWFDPSLGFRFSTYAVWRMKAALNRAEQDARLVRPPKSLWRNEDTLRRTIAEGATGYRGVHARSALKCREDALRTGRVCSGWSGFWRTPLDDIEAYEPDDEDGPATKAACAAPGLLAALSPRDRLVVERRFGIGCEPQTLSQIGRDLGITKERVRQIEKRAMAKLRAACAA